MCVDYFAHDGKGEVTSIVEDAWDFLQYQIDSSPPRIRMKLTTESLDKIDPNLDDEWAIEASTENGFIPS